MRIDVADVLGQRTEVERRTGRHAKALETFGQRAAIYDDLVRLNPENGTLLNRRMWSLANVALELRTLRKPRKALDLLERVLSERQEMVRRQPGHSGYRAAWAFCMAEVGSMKSKMPERLVDAVELLERESPG